MAFELNHDEPVGDGLSRVAKKTLSKGIDALAEGQPVEAVHDARKTVKKLRAIVSLVDGTARHLRPVKKSLRRVARRLSPLRDAHAIAETCRRLVGKSPTNLQPTLRAIARSLAARARQLERDAFHDELREDTRRKLRRAKRALRRTHLDRVSDAAAAAGVKRAYRRARRALREARASGNPVDFHQWRKEVKTLWYHARLLGAQWHMQESIESLGHIEEWLGEDHNVAILRERLARHRQWRVPALLTGIEESCERYQAELRRQAVAVGEQFFAEPPGAFVRHVRAAQGTEPPRREQQAA